MPLTTLDPRTALIVVDLQKGIAAFHLAGMDEVVRRGAALAEAFRVRDLPVVLVTAIGLAPGRTEQASGRGPFPPDFAELIAELNHQPQDHLVTKRTWGAFTNTDLDMYLKEQGVTQVVVAGVATSLGVESTARQAYEFGYNVALAVDAMTDLSAEAHTNSVARIFPRLGETGSSDEVIARLPAGRGC
jgi:nicotinamidase-related amidase